MTTATETVTTDLILAAQGGDQNAMWQIIDAYDPLLHSIVRKVATQATPDQREDLHQEARAVLLTRVRSYEATADAAALHSYAYRWVYAAVRDEWLRTSTGLTIEPGALRKVRKALTDHAHDVDAAADALWATYGIPRTVVTAVVEAARPEMHWTDVVQRNGHGSTNALTLADVVADPSMAISDSVERRDFARWLLDQIAVRQSHALRTQYGIQMGRQETRDVAAELGVSAATVRQLRTRGISSARQVAARHGVAA